MSEALGAGGWAPSGSPMAPHPRLLGLEWGSVWEPRPHLSNREKASQNGSVSQIHSALML